MPNLNLDCDYFDHRKTKRLIGLLGKGSAELPIRLWTYCGKFHPDGILAGYSAQEIETLVGWWGKAGEAVKAMLAVGFLKKKKNGNNFQVHDFKEMQGHIEAFSERARAAAKARWGRYRSNASSNATSINEQSPIITIPTIPALPTKPKVINDSTSASADETKTGDLIIRLLEEMKSPQSEGFYRNVIRELGPGIVEECLGEVRYRSKTAHIENPAAYLTTLLKQRIAEIEKAKT